MEALGTYSQPFFAWLLDTTIIATIVVCLILAVQKLLGSRLGPGWCHALWLILLIRMVLPWAPDSRISIFNLLGVLFERDLPEFAPGGYALIASSPAVGEQATEITIVTTLPVIWLAGAVSLACYMLAANLAFWAKVSREKALADKKILELLQECTLQMGVRVSLRAILTDRVRSPAVFGFVRPRLLLPPDMVEALSLEELRYVFLHELAHLKRHDIFMAHLTSLLQILHWFNPVIWLAFYRMRADRELACDALVLSKMNVGEPKKYGRAIISLVELFHQNRHLPAMVGILESKSELKRRIAMIAQFKKLSKRWSLLAVLIIALVAAVALTNARSSSESNADHTRSSDIITSDSTETKTGTPTPMGYGDYSIRTPQGYGAYSRSGDRRTPRTRIYSSAPGGANNSTHTPVGYGGYALGYGDYGLGYGGYRVKDTKESDRPDSNSPSTAP